MGKTTGSKLNALRKRAGMSLAGVARGAGYAGPSSVQVYFSQDYDELLQPGVAKRLATALVGKGDPSISASEILSLTEDVAYDVDAGLPRVIEQYYPRSAELQSNVLDVRPTPIFVGTPVYVSESSDRAIFKDGHGVDIEVEISEFGLNAPFHHVQLPQYLDRGRLFIVYVADTSMQPRYRLGEPLLISQTRPPSLGDDVFVELHSNKPRRSTQEEEGQLLPEVTDCLIKTLTERNSSFVELRQHEPPLTFRIPASRVKSVRRVIPWFEAVGL